MTKLSPEDETKGRFVGDAPMGPPRAKAGVGTCPTCQSPEWTRIEEGHATRVQLVTMFADGTAVPRDLEDWDVDDPTTRAWRCRNGHTLEDAVLIDLFNTAMEFGEPIGV